MVNVNAWLMAPDLCVAASRGREGQRDREGQRKAQIHSKVRGVFASPVGYGVHREAAPRMFRYGCKN